MLQVEYLVIDKQEMYDGEKTKQTMTSQVRTYWWILEIKNMTIGEQITAEQTSHTSLFWVHKEMDGMMDTTRLWLTTPA